MTLRIRAIWVLRLWLATELVVTYESVRNPRSDLDSSLFAMVSILGAALTAGWLARHGRHLHARWSTQFLADRLAAISALCWVLALTAFSLSAELGLLDVGKGLAVAAFALSSVWTIKHRPRWIIAGLTVMATTNWLASSSGHHDRHF